MVRIVFLVKNHIGFGHIQRSILIAKEISALAPEIDIVFISQAKSLLPFQGSPYRIINFPYLSRLPSSVLDALYETMLNDIILNLNPTMVIVDTYPDESYLSVPALQEVPKILVLRRLDPVFFDVLRRKGLFSVFDRVLVVHEEQEFFTDRHVLESELLVRMSDLFRFVGPVFRLPSEGELQQAKEKYAVGNERLIVINAGAGGDQLNDAYCERLFISMIQVAQRFLDQGISARFIFVTGPYYKGTLTTSLTNTVILAFEPHLVALLHIADIVVIRPGYNVTHEALSGPAEIIVAPGISYWETQHIYSRYLRERHNINVANNEDPDLLFNLIRDLLQKGPHGTTRDRIVPHQAEAARFVIQELPNYHVDDTPVPLHRGISLLLAIGNISASFAPFVRTRLPQIALVTDQMSLSDEQDLPNLDYLFSVQQAAHDDKNFPLPYVFLQSSTEARVDHDTLIKHGTRAVFYTNKNRLSEVPADGVTAKEWCEHYIRGRLGLLEVELYHFTVIPGRKLQSQLCYRISKMFLQKRPIGLYLDASLLKARTDFEVFIDELSNWLKCYGGRLLSIRQAIKELTVSQLG